MQKQAFTKLDTVYKVNYGIIDSIIALNLGVLLAANSRNFSVTFSYAFVINTKLLYTIIISITDTLKVYSFYQNVHDTLKEVPQTLKGIHIF